MTSTSCTSQLCPQCEGQRTITELYNFRRLEKSCTFCSESGTLRDLGHESEASTVKDYPLTSRDDWVEAEKKRYRKRRQTKLRGTVEKLEARVQGYHVELEALKKQQADSTAENLAELRSRLILQVENQMLLLQQTKLQKLSDLEQLKS